MTTRNIPETRPGRDGFAMVTALLVVLVLSVLAVGAAWLARSEKKTTVAESVHLRSVFAADAGGEAAINFVRTSNLPPQILDFGTMAVRNQTTTTLEGSQQYSYDVNFERKRLKPGWGVDYLDYDYEIGSQGQASRLGQSGVQVVVSRMYKEGY
jgi:Tfp pilus assembly protein PilX